MDSIFTRIIKREIGAHIIYEDDMSLVIPDKFPSMPGQLLVISKRQVPYLGDLDEAEYNSLMTTTRRVTKALDAALSTLRTCVVIEGFEVPHVHIRLYPCTEPGLTLLPRYEAQDEDLALLTKKVQSHLR
jgi:histidine triad (HIT) family protein